MYVVLFNPGSAGNMVTAVIDSIDYKFDATICGNMTSPGTSYRHKLIKTAFINDDVVNHSNLDSDILTIEKKTAELCKEINDRNIYSCICSHMIHYFINNTDYKIILVDDSEDTISQWTLDRAIKYGHPVDNSTLRERRNVINHYKNLEYSNRITKVIDMNDILNGNLINVLKTFIDTPLNEKLYAQWLKDNVHT